MPGIVIRVAGAGVVSVSVGVALAAGDSEEPDPVAPGLSPVTTRNGARAAIRFAFRRNSPAFAAATVGLGVIGLVASLAAVGLLARDVVVRVERLAQAKGFLAGNVRTFLRYGAALGICAVGTGVVVRTLLQL